MAILKIKDIKAMRKEDREKKLKELKFELIKSKGKVSQGGSLKTREIKKTIARLLTIK
ncbi:50S ribosomal protein L29 [Candidatus Pacearchaeota archaeon]|nr:50S ribosomal protein L29 [Candidatus Pacearchaeota archaeon]